MALELLGEWAILVLENLGVILLELGEHFLSVLHLHQGWLQTLDGVQDLSLEVVIRDDIECFLQNIVAKLVVDETLNNEMNPRLERLGLPESLHQLSVIVFESALEYLLNVMVAAVKAFFNHVGGELQLTQANEVFCNLPENLFVFGLVAKFEYVLN